MDYKLLLIFLWISTSYSYKCAQRGECQCKDLFILCNNSWLSESARQGKQMDVQSNEITIVPAHRIRGLKSINLKGNKHLICDKLPYVEGVSIIFLILKNK